VDPQASLLSSYSVGHKGAKGGEIRFSTGRNYLSITKISAKPSDERRGSSSDNFPADNPATTQSFSPVSSPDMEGGGAIHYQFVDFARADGDEHFARIVPRLAMDVGE